ncbi:MAG: hypothetical protein E7068_06930 [Lentimicrobiaceae bacterium]|nr:hypothetical protein [Lentimicrobiaceae bacterium]
MKFRRFLLLSLALFLAGNVTTQAQEDCETDYSLYREYISHWKQAKYNPKNINQQMITSWRNVYNNCPSLRQNTYLDGVTIMTYAFIRPEKNAEIKDKYVDTLIMIYDKRAEYFPNGKNGSQVGNIMGRKGIDIFTWAPHRYEEAYNALKQAIELDGTNSNYAFINTYFTTVITMVKNGKLEESAILDEYDRLSGIVDYNIKVNTEMANEKVLNNFNETKANLDLAVQPYANCEDLVRIYQPKFDANPNDVELLTKIAQVLEKRKCDDSELYLAVAVNLHKVNPSPESAYLIGKKYLAEKDYNQATKYLLESTKSENTDWAHQSYIYLAQIMNMNKNYEQGRTYARRAYELDKSNGEPFIIIGQLYAASAKDCGSGDFYSKTAFWAAVDQFEKAKSIDPSLKDKANELINAYVHYFPTIESIFFNGFEEGQDFTIEGCWINETTKVRAAKTE